MNTLVQSLRRLVFMGSGACPKIKSGEHPGMAVGAAENCRNRR